MFGPYRVEHEGRAYFGNVSLREFHLFNHDGNFYLLDVVNMAAHPISPRLAATVRRVVSSSGCLIPRI